MKTKRNDPVHTAKLDPKRCPADGGSANRRGTAAQAGQAADSMLEMLSLLLLLALILVVGLLSSCAASSGGTLSVLVAAASNQTTVAQGQSVQITATMKNAGANSGVTWNLSGPNCPSNCGSLSSMSANPTTYMAPSAVAASFMVTVTATAAQDATKSAAVTLMVTPPPPVAVTFTTAPPASLIVNAMANIVAHVANDSTNAGVDWILTCGGGACGTITAHTASDAVNVYTAPAAIPPSAVTIKATSTADSTKSVSGMVTIMPPPTIAVTLTTAPPASMAVNTMANIVAHVANDSSNAGIDWTLTCGSGACGSITAHTASDAVNVYTAPAAIPPSAVTIKAASMADPTKSVSSNVTITSANPNNSKLSGQFAFLLAGWDDSSGFAPSAIAGSFMADGNGTVTSGVIDRALSSGVHLSEAFTGSYSIGNDNRGTLSITITSGGNTLSFRFALTSLNNAKIIGFGNTPDTNFQASGVLERQDTTDFGINGNYVFGMEGVTLSNTNRSAAVGRFTCNSPGSISSGTIDVGAPLSASGALALSGNFGAPNMATGRGTLSLSAPSVNPISLVYYQINSQEFLILDVDTANRILYTGSILMQTRPAGGFKASSFNSTVVFGLTGYDGSHSQSNTGIGFVTADGGGNVSSAFLDQNADAMFVSAGTIGTYTFDADGNGRAILNLTGVQPNTLYFIDVNRAFFLQGTPADVGEDVTFGIAEQQSMGLSMSSFSGTYAFSTAHPVTPFVPNFSGELTATGASGTFSGTMDATFGQGGSTKQPDLSVSGTFQFTAGKNGRFTVTFTPQGGTPIHMVLWFISPTRAVGVISDATTTDSAVIIFEQ